MAWRARRPHALRLENLGNTCYANAVLNAVAKLASCRAWLANHQRRRLGEAGHDAECLLCALAEDVARLTTLHCNEPFAPSVVQKRARWDAARTFDNRQQHDANEALGALLGACDALDLAAFRALAVGGGVRADGAVAYTSPHWKMFGALTKQTTRCSRCPRIVEQYAMLNTLPVAVPLHGRPTVEALITETLGNEPLDDPDDRCPCGATGARTKTTTMVRKPEIFVLHLKRWAFDAARCRHNKVHTPVSFETLLTLDVGASYDLRSVVVHHGEAGSGHYTAFVRAQSNFWYHTDDDEPPEQCSTDQVLAAEAYMLFYERR